MSFRRISSISHIWYIMSTSTGILCFHWSGSCWYHFSVIFSGSAIQLWRNLECQSCSHAVLGIAVVAGAHYCHHVSLTGIFIPKFTSTPVMLVYVFIISLLNESSVSREVVNYEPENSYIHSETHPRRCQLSFSRCVYGVILTISSFLSFPNSVHDTLFISSWNFDTL